MSEWDQLDAWAAEQARNKTPSWYTPTKERATQNRNAARGLHPMGFRLANNGETCGSCAHLVRKRRCSRTYLKCRVGKNTSGPATDIRAQWGACEKWETRDGNDPR